jgi:mono/diheme cytochrome c family protein
MRWIVRIVVGFVAVAVVIVGGLYLAGTAKLNQEYSIAEPALLIPSDAASIARGAHLVSAIAKCSDCHGAGLGGSVFLDVPPFRVVAPNLTRGNGGVGSSFTDADYARAIRDGVGPDGRGLVVMPSFSYQYLSDADLADIIAYARSRPAADSNLPDTDIRPLGRILVAVGQLPAPDAASIDHAMRHVATMQPAATVEYGRYIAQTGGCTGCHGAGLSGGAVPGVPPSFPHAQNITPTGIGQWSDADIVRALRVGKRPDGSTMSTFMPWPATAKMTDQEMTALIMFLGSVPPRPTGTR